MTWMERALCRDKPSDWWMVPDGGNRLALMLCSVCPTLTRCAEDDREPHGVIRAGVAYGDFGQRLPLCFCGRPVTGAQRQECFTCDPRRTAPSSVRHPLADQVSRLLAEGLSFRMIGLRVGLSKSMISKIVKKHRLCPQAVSTVVDGSAP